MIKKFEDFLNEAEVEKKSYYFSGEPSVDLHIESRAGRLSIWINGGNAFVVNKVSTDILKKLGDNSEAQKEVESKIMELVVKTMEEHIEKIIEDTIK